jgi:hypothetical protein
MGGLTTFFIFKGAILINPSAMVLEHWACPLYKHIFELTVAK